MIIWRDASLVPSHIVLVAPPLQVLCLPDAGARCWRWWRGHQDRLEHLLHLLLPARRSQLLQPGRLGHSAGRSLPGERERCFLPLEAAIRHMPQVKGSWWSLHLTRHPLSSAALAGASLAGCWHFLVCWRTCDPANHRAPQALWMPFQRCSRVYSAVCRGDKALQGWRARGGGGAEIDGAGALAAHTCESFDLCLTNAWHAHGSPAASRLRMMQGDLATPPSPFSLLPLFTQSSGGAHACMCTTFQH